jgi:hypothetical protein
MIARATGAMRETGMETPSGSGFGAEQLFQKIKADASHHDTAYL